MSTNEKIKVADEVMERMKSALGVEFSPEQVQFNRGYLVAMMDAAEQSVKPTPPKAGVLLRDGTHFDPENDIAF